MLSGGIITAPVRTIDIAQAVGLDSGDIGELCRDGNINKWAKNKPFRADLSGNKASLQDRIDANFGLNFNVTEGEVGNDVIGAVKRAAMDANCYAYDSSASHSQGRPRGNTYHEGYRERDFEGYRVDAPAPIQPFQRLDINRFLYDTYITEELYSTDIEVSAYQITMADVIAGVLASTGGNIDLSNYHIIVAVQYNNTGGFYVVSEEPIGQSSRRFRFNFLKQEMVDGDPNFYVAAISDRAAGYYSKVVGLPFLRVDSGYSYGQFHVRTTIPFQFDWQRIDTYSGWPQLSWENMDTNQYRARYYQYQDQSGAEDIHLQLSGDCDMAYGFKVTNTDQYAARLTLSHISLQSLSVAASGWPSGSISYYPTGKIRPSTAYYSTTKSGAWQSFPSSGYIDISAGGVIYLWIVIYQFQRYLNGSVATAISGSSTRGAELQLFYNDRQLGLIHEEYWQKNAYINITKP